MANVYEQVKQAWQDVIVPEIKEFKLDEKIDSRFKTLDEKIGLGFEFRDRFAVLETKVAALTSR